MVKPTAEPTEAEMIKAIKIRHMKRKACREGTKFPRLSKEDSDRCLENCERFLRCPISELRGNGKSTGGGQVGDYLRCTIADITELRKLEMKALDNELFRLRNNRYTSKPEGELVQIPLGRGACQFVQCFV